MNGILETLKSANRVHVLYAIYCLGELGDASVMPTLAGLQEEFTKLQRKGPYDFAILGQLRSVFERLGAT